MAFVDLLHLFKNINTVVSVCTEILIKYVYVFAWLVTLVKCAALISHYHEKTRDINLNVSCQNIEGNQRGTRTVILL